MALINCPECDKEVSEKAPKCPNCGVYISAMHKYGWGCFTFWYAWPFMLFSELKTNPKFWENPRSVSSFILWIPICFLIGMIIGGTLGELASVLSLWDNGPATGIVEMIIVSLIAYYFCCIRRVPEFHQTLWGDPKSGIAILTRIAFCLLLSFAFGGFIAAPFLAFIYDVFISTRGGFLWDIIYQGGNIAVFLLVFGILLRKIVIKPLKMSKAVGTDV